MRSLGCSQGLLRCGNYRRRIAIFKFNNSIRYINNFYGAAVIRDFDIQLLRAFSTVVETRNVSAAGRRLGRSQPAVSIQLKRLEQASGKGLFKTDRRRFTLTRDGEILLGYARRILRINDEARAHLSQIEVEGKVVLGTPDLYAAYLLPGILGNFGHKFPQVEIELRCALRNGLMTALDRKEIDLVLVTQLPSATGGQFVRYEQLVWVTSRYYDVHKKNPVPLALLPSGYLYRDLALAALDEIGRKWRLACVSESIAGLHAAVYAGLAVSVLAECAVTEELRPLGVKQRFPKLPAVPLALYRKPGPPSDAAAALSDYIIEHLYRAS